MAESDDQSLDEAVREAEEIRVLRAARDRELSPEERLRRVDALCRLDALCNLLVTLDARLLRDPRRKIDPEIRASLYRGRNLTVTTSLAAADALLVALAEHLTEPLATKDRGLATAVREHTDVEMLELAP